MSIVLEMLIFFYIMFNLIGIGSVVNNITEIRNNKEITIGNFLVFLIFLPVFSLVIMVFGIETFFISCSKGYIKKKFLKYKIIKWGNK